MELFNSKEESLSYILGLFANAQEDSNEYIELEDKIYSLIPKYIRSSFNDLVIRLSRELFKNYEFNRYKGFLLPLTKSLWFIIETGQKNPELLFKFFGITIENKKLIQVEPDLSPLGSFSQYLKMKEYAIEKLRKRSSNVTDPKIKAEIWRRIYLREDLLKYLGKREYKKLHFGRPDLYREIMDARMEYCLRNNIAPYWYWFANTVSTNLAYPLNYPVDVVGKIKEYVTRLIQNIDKDSKETSFFKFNLIFDINSFEKDAEKFIEDTIISAFGSFEGEPKIRKIFRFYAKKYIRTELQMGGSFEGKSIHELNPERIRNMIERGQIKRARSGQAIITGGEIMIRYNYYYNEPGRRGQWTGLYTIERE